MEHEEPPFGFWIPVKDRASATYAAKMSGGWLWLREHSADEGVF